VRASRDVATLLFLWFFVRLLFFVLVELAAALMNENSA
jgi:hypothetical protein